jgi:CDK-activating kinase assembly factor MAT1
VLRTFNYNRKDFENQEQYDEYLEKVEDYIFTLTEGTDDEKNAVRQILKKELQKNSQNISNKKS